MCTVSYGTIIPKYYAGYSPTFIIRIFVQIFVFVFSTFVLTFVSSSNNLASKPPYLHPGYSSSNMKWRISLNDEFQDANPFRQYLLSKTMECFVYLKNASRRPIKTSINIMCPLFSFLFHRKHCVLKKNVFWLGKKGNLFSLVERETSLNQK